MIARCGSLAITFTVNLLGKVSVFRFRLVVEIKGEVEYFVLWDLIESISGSSQGNQNQTHSSKDPDYDRIDEGKILERKFKRRYLCLAQYDARHPMEQQRADNHQ